tara:strand:- start:8608 stop:10968 length:2361 start_codon:yes stop_codon:yes gene_type:complete
MSSRLRNKSQQQADREIRRQQSGFLGGVNLDLPRSEINDTQVCNSNNIVSYRTHVETRAGTERIGEMPGGGTVHNLYFHQTLGQYILHRSDRIYVSKTLLSGSWTESINITDVIDAASNMRAYKDDLIIFQDDKLSYLELSNPNELILRRLNSSNPVGSLNVINETNVASSGPYAYRFIYTYYRDVNGITTAESGPALMEYGGQEMSVSTVFCDTPIEQNTISIQGFIAPTEGDSTQNLKSAGIGSMEIGDPDPMTGFMVSAIDVYATQWTGIKVYRTTDYGVEDGEQYTFGLVGTYTFAQANNWQAGIGTMIIGSTFTLGSGTNNIAMSDSLLAGGELLTSYGYTPLPNGLVGEVTPGHITVASDNDSTYYYSETGGKVIRAGYYFAGGQFQELDGSIKGIFRSPDSLTILCKNSTYRVSVLNTLLNGNSPGDIIAFGSLYPPTLMDENVGVTDIGSVSFMDRSRFIALCSDYTIRVFDGVNWGYDRAKQLVSSEIRKAAIGSTAIYHPDGYYILWYKDDSSLSKPNKTLRLGLVEDVGIGWSPYSGNDWISPPSRQGIVRGVDPTTSLMMIVGANTSNNTITQIETFDGPESSRFVRRTTDDFGGNNSDYSWSVDLGELTGSTESLWVLHENTNFFMRPFERDTAYPSDLELTIKGYIDDEAVQTASFFTEDLDGDISFDKNLNGKRIRLQISGNKSNIKMVGTETVYRVQDRPSRSNSNKVADYQLELATGLLVWATRTNPLENIMRLPTSTDRNAAVVGQVGLVQDQLGTGNYAMYFNGESI